MASAFYTYESLIELFSQNTVEYPAPLGSRLDFGRILRHSSVDSFDAPEVTFDPFSTETLPHTYRFADSSGTFTYNSVMGPQNKVTRKWDWASSGHSSVAGAGAVDRLSAEITTSPSLSSGKSGTLLRIDSIQSTQDYGVIVYKMTYSKLEGQQSGSEIENTTFEYKDRDVALSFNENKKTQNFGSYEESNIQNYRYKNTNSDIQLSFSSGILKTESDGEWLPNYATLELKNVVFENSDIRSATGYALKTLDRMTLMNIDFEPDVFGEIEGNLGMERTYFDFIDPYVLKDSRNVVNVKNNSGVLVETGGGNDAIYGGSGSDTLNGQEGNDLLAGGLGDDFYVLYSSSGTDVITDAGGDNDVLVWLNKGPGFPDDSASAPDLYLSGNDLTVANLGEVNRVSATVRNFQSTGRMEGITYAELDGEWGIDDYRELVVASTSVLPPATDPFLDPAGPQEPATPPSTSTTFNRVAIGSMKEEWLVGAAGSNDMLLGGDGTDVLSAGSGNDSISGGAGDDYLIAGAGIDTLVGGQGDDQFLLDSKSGKWKLWTDTTIDTPSSDIKTNINEERIFDGSGSNSIQMYLNNTASNFIFETIRGNNGFWYARVFNADNPAGAYYTYIGPDTSLDGGIAVIDNNKWVNKWSLVQAPTSPTTRENSSDNEFFVGSVANEILNGEDGDDVLNGGGGNDTLNGGTGSDYLVGGAGTDSLLGGLGDDIYILGYGNGLDGSTSTPDSVTEQLDEGYDRIVRFVQFDSQAKNTLSANVEALTLVGQATSGFGNELDNEIIGNRRNNTINGGTGNDWMQGGLGNDVYTVDSLGDIVVEYHNEGYDTVITSVSYRLDQDDRHVERLQANSTLGLELTGNWQRNYISGGSGNDTLDGAWGADTLVGGTGNDTYLVGLTAAGALEDTVIETSTTSTELDTVRLLGTSTNTAAVLIRTLANIEHVNASGTGTSLLNLLGNTLANTLTGNDAANNLDGGLGNDTLFGGAGADLLTGGAGSDSLVGGGGNDTYVVALTTAGTLEDTVTESSTTSTEIDTLRLTGSYNSGAMVINALANIENVDASATGTSLLNLLGNSLANTLTGNGAANNLDGGAGNDTLDGGAGNDTLIGGAGNDTLIGNSGLDSLKGDLGSDTFVFAAGASASGQTIGFDTISDYTKGVSGTGDLIDFFSANLSIGGSTTGPSDTEASISLAGLATFATGSGSSLSDALSDIASRFNVASDAAGEFAFFRLNNTGNHYMFISDGTAGVSANDVVVQLVGVTQISTIDITTGNLTIIV